MAGLKKDGFDDARTTFKLLLWHLAIALTRTKEAVNYCFVVVVVVVLTR